MDAYMTYTGSKSMEIQIDLVNSNKELMLNAKFVFVAKQSLNVLVSYEAEKPIINKLSEE